MGNVSKESESNTVHDGVDPRRVLRERGVDYDGSAPILQVPDFLGYLFGLLLIWLVYTGYGSVVGMMTDPDGTVAKISDKASSLATRAKSEAKIHTAPLASELQGAVGRARLRSDSASIDSDPIDPEKGWWGRQLDSINYWVDWAADSAASVVMDEPYEEPETAEEEVPEESSIGNFEQF